MADEPLLRSDSLRAARGPVRWIARREEAMPCSLGAAEARNGVRVRNDIVCCFGWGLGEGDGRVGCWGMGGGRRGRKIGGCVFSSGSGIGDGRHRLMGLAGVSRTARIVAWSSFFSRRSAR